MCSKQLKNTKKIFHTKGTFAKAIALYFVYLVEYLDCLVEMLALNDKLCRVDLITGPLFDLLINKFKLIID